MTAFAKYLDHSISVFLIFGLAIAPAAPVASGRALALKYSTFSEQALILRPINFSRAAIQKVGSRIHLTTVSLLRGFLKSSIEPDDEQAVGALIRKRGGDLPPDGMHWKLIGTSTDHEGRIYTARRIGAPAAFEDEFIAEALKKYPAYMKRLGFNSTDGGRTISYPDLDGLNRRLWKMRVPIQFYPADGKVPTESYLERFAKGSTAFLPLAQSGPIHFHDMFAHVFGFSLLNARLLAWMQAPARFLLAVQKDPVLRERYDLQERVAYALDQKLDEIPEADPTSIGSMMLRSGSSSRTQEDFQLLASEMYSVDNLAKFCLGWNYRSVGARAVQPPIELSPDERRRFDALAAQARESALTESRFRSAVEDVAQTLNAREAAFAAEKEPAWYRDAAATHYDVLGVPSDATHWRIRSAYLAWLDHWTEKVREGSDLAWEIVARLNAAFWTLRDSALRERYDLELLSAGYFKRLSAGAGDEVTVPGVVDWTERAARRLKERILDLLREMGQTPALIGARKVTPLAWDWAGNILLSLRDIAVRRPSASIERFNPFHSPQGLENWLGGLALGAHGNFGHAALEKNGNKVALVIEPNGNFRHRRLEKKKIIAVGGWKN